MPNTTTSTNMLLPIPVVGTDPGPDYADNINNCLTIIDSHNHAAGYGVPITPAGLNISSDLPMGGNNLTTVRTTRFSSQAAVLGAAADVGCLYEVVNDLYFNDGLGNQIRITQSGAIAGAPGTITGLVAPASASYSAGNFVFQSDSNVAANLDGASVKFRNTTASSFACTVSPPNAMGSNYSLTLPALPASQKIMTLDASGNMSAPYTIDGTTLQISTNVIQVKAKGIAAAQIADGTITGTQITNNVNLPGGAVTSDSKRLVSSNVNPTGALGLCIVRGATGSAGNPQQGEGFTVTPIATGVYQIDLTPSIGDSPVIAITLGNLPSGLDETTPLVAYVYGVNAGSFRVSIKNSTTGTYTDAAFGFIAVGMRNT